MKHSNVVRHILTVDERDSLVSILESIKPKIFQDRGVPLTNLIDSSIPVSFAGIIKEDKASFLGNDSAYLESLLSDLESIPVLLLRAGFYPSNLTIQKVYAFFASTVLDPFFIRFEYDVRIIGGIIVVWKGRYLDLTLNSYFEAISQEEIEPLLKKIS